MARFGQLVLIFILCLVNSSFAGWRAKNETRIHKFVGFKCESLNAKVVKVEMCRIGESGGLNFEIDVIEPITEVFVIFSYFSIEIFVNY